MARARAFASQLPSRRAEMCRISAQIFRDRGYDATSVSDIARALGLTKAGLYHYFESKEALLFEIMTYGLDRVRDEVAVPVRSIRDPEERLRQLIVRHAFALLCGYSMGNFYKQPRQLAVVRSHHTHVVGRDNVVPFARKHRA